MTKLSVAEMHQRYPHDWDDWSWPQGTPPFNDAVAMANELHLQDDPLTYLDDIREEDYHRAIAINRTLLFLPPEKVIENFGDDVALWLSSSSVLQGDNKAINQALQDMRGYNMADFEIAKGWVWRHGHKRASTKREIALYSLMQAVKGDALQSVDLDRALIESARPEVTLSQKRLADYALVAIASDDYNSYYDGGRVWTWAQTDGKEVCYPVWIDAPTGFALTYRGIPNAIGALSTPSPHDVMIHQIQGVAGKKIDHAKPLYSKEFLGDSVSARGLAPLDWQSVIIKVSEQIATQQGAQRIAVQSATHNVWTKLRGNDKQPHITVEQAQRNYDQPAQRLGYVQDETGD